MWLFLHIACMFGAFALAVGGGLVSHYVVHSGDLAAIRRVLPAWDRLATLIGVPLFFLGIGFGFVTAVTVGFDLSAPWLIIAYVLIVAMLVNGFAVYDPQLKRLKAAAAASPDGQPSPELQALIDSPRTNLAFGPTSSSGWPSSSRWWSSPSAEGACATIAAAQGRIG